MSAIRSFFSCLLPVVALIWLAIFSLSAQGTPEDYARAFQSAELYSNKVFYADIQPHWQQNSHCFWYSRFTPSGYEYVWIDADKKSRQFLFNRDKLAKQLSNTLQMNIPANSLRLDQISVSPRADTIRFQFKQQFFTYLSKKDSLITDKKIRSVRPPSGYWGNRDKELTGPPVVSPDGHFSAYCRDFNVWIKNLATQTETPLTQDGQAAEYYSARIQWSPDGKKLLTSKITPAEQHYLYQIESSPKDQLLPKLHQYEYARPGDSLPVRHPCVIEITSKRLILPSAVLFPQPYAIEKLAWSADGQTVTFEYNQRGHQVYRLLEMDATTGVVRPLIEETSDTYINYNRLYRYDFKNSPYILWTSERDNWNHLYLYNRTTGRLIRQITKGAWYVREIVYVDEVHKQIWFTANGMVAGEDPYLIRYYRINLNGTGLTCLTPEEGMHQAWFSSDKKWMVDVYSKTDRPPLTVLRRTTDGKILMQLEKADISQLEATGWRPPETFVAPGRDDQTAMWGLIYRPSHFDPSRSYPIIEYIYSGPGDQYVPKTFQPFNWNMTPLAELGFIVVQLDAMSTSLRSKAFESICYKNLQDAGLPDRIKWIKAAARKYPYMDTTCVGIFGASAGGQEAMNATLTYPEFYKAAYAACGCQDNRLDKIWWNEQWMGYPVDKSYESASNVVNAHKLRTPLLLVVGELDNNVDPSSTMQVVNALIKANKPFELVVLPGEGHTMGGKYGEHKRFDFFVSTLLGVKPPAWE
jgi:dipeptidyl aminopeptidase/acylaminoacyl peptidase